MPDTVACPRCFRTVPLTDLDWNTAEHCCTRCEPLQYGVRNDARTDLPRRGGIGVRITGLDIPFGDLVWFMVKATFAAIPAGMLVGILLGILYLLLRSLLGPLW